MGHLPKRRKNGKVGSTLGEASLKAEAKFFRCPKGHSLPNHTKNGQCTPMHCGGQLKDQFTDLAVASSTNGKSAAYDPEKERSQQEALLNRASVRRAIREEVAPVPEGLKGGDAEAWTATQLVELSPYAVAELRYQLMYGDDEQRHRAAARILDSTGHGKKDISTGGATIIINASGGVNLPWRVPKAVEGTTKVVSSLEIGAPRPAEVVIQAEKEPTE